MCMCVNSGDYVCMMDMSFMCPECIVCYFTCETACDVFNAYLVGGRGCFSVGDGCLRFVAQGFPVKLEGTHWPMGEKEGGRVTGMAGVT